MSGRPSAAGKHLSREETRKYELSREVVEKTIAAGKLKRLTVAAIVDEETASADAAKVRELLEAASGYDEARGDKLVIETMAIAAIKIAEESEQEAEEAAAAQRRQQQFGMMANYGSGLAAFIVLGAAIFLGSRQVRNAVAAVAVSTGTPPDRAAAPSQQQGNASSVPQLPASSQRPRGPADRPGADAVDEEALLDAARAARLSNEDLTQIVRKMAAERPEAVVKQLERWLAGKE